MIKTEHGQDVPGAPTMPKHQTKINAKIFGVYK